MPTNTGVVLLDHQHINVKKEEVKMDSKKEFKFGNSTVIVHSPLVNMTRQERQDWYENEWNKGNTTLKGIVAAVQDCLQSSQ